MNFIFDPKIVLEKVGVTPGSIVADFGSGSGHWAVELAKLVGEEGKVYAIDVLKPTLESVRTLAQIHKVSNIETKWSDIEKTSGLEAGSCDLIVISNLFFQVDQEGYKNVIEEARKVLKPEGRLLVVDWTKESKVGPEQDQRTTLEEIKSLAEDFKKSEEISIGSDHWGLLLYK